MTIDELSPEMAERIASGTNWLELWLEVRGITLAQLASIADITIGDLRRIGDGDQQPTAGQIERIAHALNLSPAVIEASIAA